MKSKFTYLYILAYALLSIHAKADTLKITVTVTASGYSFAPGSSTGIAFTNAQTTFTYIGDTANTTVAGAYDYSSSGIETTTVSGQGTYADSRSWSAQLNRNGSSSSASFGRSALRPDGGGGLSIVSFNPLFNNGSLTSDFGPISAATDYYAGFFSNQVNVGDLANGEFSFYSISPTAIYQATNYSNN